MMNQTEHHEGNAFRRWRETVGLKDYRQAAPLLGKSLRMVEYYEAGRTPPLDTRLLMAAIADGYRPRPWPEK